MVEDKFVNFVVQIFLGVYVQNKHFLVTSSDDKPVVVVKLNLVYEAQVQVAFAAFKLLVELPSLYFWKQVINIVNLAYFKLLEVLVVEAYKGSVEGKCH
jgi:hypothetical protein